MKLAIAITNANTRAMNKTIIFFFFKKNPYLQMGGKNIERNYKNWYSIDR